MSCDRDSDRPRQAGLESGNSGAPGQETGQSLAAGLVSAAQSGVPVIYEQAVLALDLGYAYSCDELLALDNPPRSDGWSLAHEMVRRGMCLSAGDVIVLGDPRDSSYHSLLDVAAEAAGWPKPETVKQKALSGAALSLADLAVLKMDSGVKTQLTYAHQVAKKGRDFSIEEIIAMGDPVALDGSSLSSYVCRPGKFSMDDLLRLGDPGFGWKLSHVMARQGYPFKVSDLQRIGNPSDRREGWTVAHHMAASGRRFSLDELLQLMNPPDHEGFTVAHVMATYGCRFSVEEIQALRNPADKYGSTLAHTIAFHSPDHFSVDDLIRLGNPRDRFGKTVAHEAAANGRQFTVSELIRLGDPVSDDGKHVSDWLRVKLDEKARATLAAGLADRQK